MKQFEELLADVMHAVENDMEMRLDEYSEDTKHARSALVEFVRERTAESDRLRHEIEHPHDAAEFEALRAERDAARRELCEMWSSEFGTHEHVADVREYAASRGWSYLYEEKK